jgi:hypothetical protein
MPSSQHGIFVETRLRCLSETGSATIRALGVRTATMKKTRRREISGSFCESQFRVLEIGPRYLAGSVLAATQRGDARRRVEIAREGQGHGQADIAWTANLALGVPVNRCRAYPPFGMADSDRHLQNVGCGDFFADVLCSPSIFYSNHSWFGLAVWGVFLRALSAEPLIAGQVEL